MWLPFLLNHIHILDGVHRKKESHYVNVNATDEWLKSVLWTRGRG